MIHWAWALGAFVLGSIFGLFLTLLLMANNDGDEGMK